MKIKRIVLVLVVLVLIGVSLLCVRNELLHRNDLKNYPVCYRDQIAAYSTEFGLDPYLVLAIMRTESSFLPTAVSPKGAIGLMQIMPETGKWIAHKLKMDEIYSDTILYEPENNIRFACWYLRFLSDRFSGYDTAVVCAYNAGHGTLERWLANPDYTDNGELRVIPNDDVARYLGRVRNAYAKYKELYPTVF